ncbi:hypothetical protein ABW02_26350, partial [Niallia circulans]
EKSAKTRKYQPTGRRNQPKLENISQPEGEISQNQKISANRKEKSAKTRKYQPTGRRNQPKPENISQPEEGISQN